MNQRKSKVNIDKKNKEKENEEYRQEKRKWLHVEMKVNFRTKLDGKASVGNPNQ